MFTKLSQADRDFPVDKLAQLGQVKTIQANGLPAPHPSDPDTFARHVDIPGHDQTAFSDKHIVLVGAGGLNGLATLGFLRSGAKYVTVIDPDLVERTNLPRQLFYGKDLGFSKAIRLIENLQEDAIAGASLTAIAMRFEEAVENYALPMDLLVVGVDRNDCRKFAVELAHQRGIPAIFTMLSRDGMRCHSFLQGPRYSDACLWCALPNLDPDQSSPCASAIITSCMLASSMTIFFGHRALMGWPPNIVPFNFREADLLGMVPDRCSFIPKQPGCKICGKTS